MIRMERAVLPALLVAVPVAVVAVAVGSPPSPSDGFSAPGGLTGAALPAARAVHDAAAALTVGLLIVTATVLVADPQHDSGMLSGLRLRAARLAAAAGAAWVIAGAAVLVLTYVDVSGVSPNTAGFADQLAGFVVDFELGRALAVSWWLALAMTCGAALARRVTSVGLLAVLALLALLPLAISGHSAAARSHGTAVDTLAGHLIGLAVWVGGLAALLVLHRRLGAQAPVAVSRYSALAGWCYGLVAISGLAAAYARLPGPAGLASSYGALLAAKVTAVLALGWAGWRQRKAIRVAADRAGSASGVLLTRLALGEVAVMGAAIGLGVALSRVGPPPARPDGPAAADPNSALLGYPMPPPLTPWRWVTHWQPDVLWLSVAAVAAAWYLFAVRRLRSRDDRWPVGRTLAWVTGWAGLTWATSSGPGAYGSVLFSMHMVSHMTVAMAVPIFLVLGAPVTLALRTLPARRDGSRGPREWLLAAVRSRALRLLAHPLVAAGLFLGSLVVFYYTPVFELALRTHTGHVVMTLHFLLSGYLFASVICGIDPGPARPPYVFRLILLVATMGFHAFFGVAMMGSSEILGRDWFVALDRDWGRSLAQEQNLGGALAWALGDYPVAIMISAMAWSWIKADDRESRRYDRKAAHDGDAELVAYNAYLRRLADRHECSR